MALFAVVHLLCGTGCGFEPREGPPPCDPSDPDCGGPPPPLTPEILRDNIERALEQRIVDPDYEVSLSEAFVYVPDPFTEALRPGFFAGWNKRRELEFMRTLLLSSVTAVQVEFLRYEDTGELPDTNLARYRVEYVMSVTFTDDSSDCYSASALWDLEGGDRNDWTLLVWTDIEPLNETCAQTVGLLRVQFGPDSLN